MSLYTPHPCRPDTVARLGPKGEVQDRAEAGEAGEAGEAVAQLMASLRPAPLGGEADDDDSDADYEPVAEAQGGRGDNDGDNGGMLTSDNNMLKMATGRRLKRVKYTDFVFGHELGSGSFAKVPLAHYGPSGHFVTDAMSDRLSD